MSHPYEGLDPRAYWRTGAADLSGLRDIHVPRTPITTKTTIATAGSCFAQHIGRALKTADCNLLDAEPQPAIMTDEVARRLCYGVYSARYGNVYTARAMRQLLEDAATGHTDRRHVWEKDERFYDAFRPTVEPLGLESPDEVLLLRQWHLERVAQMLRAADTMIFTLGLTEGFVDRQTGRAYPVCPGVVAGEFDAARHDFHNASFAEVRDDLDAIRALLQAFNPDMQLLLTVSPVPLTATASGNHVLQASTHSKSVLRAAVGEFVSQTAGTDYFPSYEIVTAQAMERAFEPNLRSVRPSTVAKVMDIFLSAHGLKNHATEAEPRPAAEQSDDGDLICEDLMLEAFSK